MKQFMKTYGNNNPFHQILTIYSKDIYKIAAEVVGKMFYCFVHNSVDLMGYVVIKHIPAICYIR